MDPLGGVAAVTATAIRDRTDELEQQLTRLRDEARTLRPYLDRSDRDAVVLRHVGDSIDDLIYELALIRERRSWQE